MTVVHSMDTRPKPASPSIQTPATKRSMNRNTILHLTPSADDSSDWENDLRMQSFYEQSFSEMATNVRMSNATIVNHSPMMNSQNIDPNVHTPRAPVTGRRLNTSINNNTMSNTRERRRPKVDHDTSEVIKPNKTAPTRSTINRSFDAHELPKLIHPKPFYSDRDDLLAHNARKEVGHNVLELTSNSICDLEAYNGLTDVCNLAKRQKIVADQLSMESRYGKLPAQIERNPRKALALLRPVTIKPSGRVPMAPAINSWMSSRTRARNPSPTIENVIVIDDSPVKLRREMPTCVLPESRDDLALQTRMLRKSEQDAALNGILENRNLTVSVHTKSGEKRVVIKKPAEPVNDSDDDVICLDDPLSPAVGSVKHNGLY